MHFVTKNSNVKWNNTFLLQYNKNHEILLSQKFLQEKEQVLTSLTLQILYRSCATGRPKQDYKISPFNQWQYPLCNYCHHGFHM